MPKTKAEHIFKHLIDMVCVHACTHTHTHTHTEFSDWGLLDCAVM